MKLLKVTLLFILFAPLFVQAQAVDKSILSDIKKAQQALKSAQDKVAAERAAIAKKLSVLQRQVLTQREKTAVVRRAQDENTLGLTQLQQRIDGWRAQHNFQQNLINRFIRQQDLPVPEKTGSLGSILRHSETLLAQLSPTFNPQAVITESGVIEQADVLALGPVMLFVNGEQAGLLESGNNGLKISLSLEGASRQSLLDLAKTGRGSISFDPSNSKAIAMARQHESAIEHISKGGLWAIPILFFALFALVIAIAKSWQLFRLPKIQLLPGSKLAEWISQKDLNQDNSLDGMQASLMQIARQEPNIAHRDDLLFNQLQLSKYRLERWLGAIAVVASISPLLGLLGTVSGMIETFKMMTLFGSGDPEVVSGGIAQALITTELGLVVAIPALILNALLSRRAKNYYQQLESFALQISQLSESNIKPLHSSEHEKPVRAAGAC
ncbi:MotA/TolQ/ExbB proton channel family protein [Neptunicella marina]|uniref:MotA/TolQ/ExbB proton channel family protein n=1 Tax=Neptunicella marina TaxID=2125989 RepID=A0A8J6IS04_9ALTE|nr:MotA/TolQ/ExbB proton channel family protein [Neptunicella marina]MBC3764777.1 MotA/TolQ/ExbB proton channel family protein [Neptunicella marina]